MGFTIADEIKFDKIGLSLTNTYASFSGRILGVEKADIVNSEQLYRVTAELNYYPSSSKATRSLRRNVISTYVTSSQLSSNLFTHLYNEAKSGYNSVTDV